MRRLWHWVVAEEREPCRHRHLRHACLMGISRVRGTPTLMRTIGASSGEAAGVLARSGTCVRRAVTPRRRTRIPSEVWPAPEAARGHARRALLVRECRWRCSGVRTFHPGYPPPSSALCDPYPNYSIYEVLKNLIFNSQTYITLWFIIRIKWSKCKMMPGNLFALGFLRKRKY